MMIPFAAALSAALLIAAAVWIRHSRNRRRRQEFLRHLHLVLGRTENA